MQLAVDIDLNAANTGLTLRGQLYSLTDGSSVGTEITTTFIEIGGGLYNHLYDFPDNTRIGIKYYQNGVPGTVLARVAINPEEFANQSAGAIEYTYTVTSSVTGDPIAGVLVQISTDAAGDNIVWSGVTDAFGVARNASTQEKPFLNAGTYYFWSYLAGYSFVNPDTEVVS